VLIRVEGRRAALERLDDLRARQAGATRLAIELHGEAQAATGALARLGLPFEISGARSLAVEARNGSVVDVMTSLRASGIEVKSFELQRPTLEEIFLRVVRGGGER
jgi:hypothetical protein